MVEDEKMILKCKINFDGIRYKKASADDLKGINTMTRDEVLKLLPVPKEYSLSWKTLKVRMKHAADEGWPVYFHDDGDGWYGVMYAPCNGAIIHGSKIMYMSLNCFMSGYSQKSLEQYTKARRHIYERIAEKNKLRSQLKEIFAECD